ncbi:MAG: WYL domain-containing protein, partial [Planctomycetota bacterium]|nr:WYL domain-containing protein [Planctomycetota bacterium]
ALPPARGAPMAGAVAGLVKKLERALGTRDVKRLSRRIGARRRPSALGKRLHLLQQALDDQCEVEIEYYTQRRRAFSERRVRPYALIDHLGQFYLVGRDSVRGRELSFRVDRIRTIRKTDKTFTKPRTFNAQRYRRADFYRSGQSDTNVRVRFGPRAARYVREMGPASELKEKHGGAVERNIRTDSLRWVVDWALQHGDDAEIKGPAGARVEARRVLDDWLAFYESTGSKRARIRK